MKKKIFLFVLFAIYSISSGQEKYTTVFSKLDVSDTIYKYEQIEVIKREDMIHDNLNHIYTIKNTDDSVSLCLIKKQGKYWLTFYIDNYGNESFKVIAISNNKRYLFITKEINHSARQTEIIDKSCFIIDLETNSSLELIYYNYVYYWEYEENSEFSRSTKTIEQSNLIIDDNFITMIANCYENNENIKCRTTGGLYELQGSVLKKVKFYDAETMQLKPVKYIGNLAIGMTLDDIKEVYPDINFIEKENVYMTCSEEDNMGFEVWDGSNLLGFVANNLSEQKMNRFISADPTINFGTISINTRAGDVLKLYPKANVRIDSLTEWEHMYIYELNIELVFKTDDTNRVGIYKDEIFSKINNIKAKADFIIIN